MFGEIRKLLAFFPKGFSQDFSIKEISLQKLSFDAERKFQWVSWKKNTKSRNSIAQLLKLLKTSFSGERLSSNCSDGRKDCSFDKPVENIHQRTETFSLNFPIKKSFSFSGKFTRTFLWSWRNIFVKKAKNIINAKNFSPKVVIFSRNYPKMMNDWILKKFSWGKSCTGNVKNSFDEISVKLCRTASRFSLNFRKFWQNKLVPGKKIFLFSLLHRKQLWTHCQKTNAFRRWIALLIVCKRYEKTDIFQKTQLSTKLPSWNVECWFGNFTWIIPPNGWKLSA